VRCKAERDPAEAANRVMGAAPVFPPSRARQSEPCEPICYDASVQNATQKQYKLMTCPCKTCVPYVRCVFCCANTHVPGKSLSLDRASAFLLPALGRRPACRLSAVRSDLPAAFEHAPAL
jgi:hypothetical protein